MSNPGSPRLQIRPWRVGDEEALAQIANNRKIWRNLTDQFPHPYTLEDAKEWIASASEPSDHAHHEAVLVGDELVGGVGFRRLPDLSTRTAEIGYWIGEPFWGRGYATEALRISTETAWREFDFVRLQAHVLGWNAASFRVLEKAGYTHEATLRRNGYKDGEVCDLIIYALLR